jgi:hypothetical protein
MKQNPELSERHARALARLVHEYGKEAVIEAVKSIRPRRKRGRPSSGFYLTYDAMHLATWFDSTVEHHRNRGSKKPIQDAWSDLYNLALGEHQRHPGFKPPGRLFERWRKNLQKKRALGQRHLQQLQQEVARK